MTDKNTEDMTASELLRWAALHEIDRYGNDTPYARLFSAIEGRDYYHTVDAEDREALRTLADKVNAEQKAIIEALNDSAHHIMRIWAEKRGMPLKERECISEWLDRWFLPRPRFEDGEPVQDSDLEEIGTLATCCVYTDGCWKFNPDKFDDERNPKAWSEQQGRMGDRIKRPAPEVLLGDGNPVSNGDTVYVIESGIERTVKDFGTRRCDGMDGWDGSPWVMFDNGSWMHARDLTHTPPDTQARINDDTRNDGIAYWGCLEVGCDECPARIDGKTPADRYDTPGDCDRAMVLDLLRRQRELDKRAGGDA